MTAQQRALEFSLRYIERFGDGEHSVQAARLLEELRAEQNSHEIPAEEPSLTEGAESQTEIDPGGESEPVVTEIDEEA